MSKSISKPTRILPNFLNLQKYLQKVPLKSLLICLPKSLSDFHRRDKTCDKTYLTLSQNLQKSVKVNHKTDKTCRKTYKKASKLIIRSYTFDTPNRMKRIRAKVDLISSQSGSKRDTLRVRQGEGGSTIVT